MALYDISNTIVIDAQVWGADEQCAQSMSLVLATAAELVRQALKFKQSGVLGQRYG